MSANNQPGQKHLDIRKYPNRRYYDTTHSRHLTLEEIRSLIQDGYDIKVTDSKTGADITAQLLTQIILELETPKLDSFSIPMLVRMIRANDQLVRDFVGRYFNEAFNAYLEYQKQVEERMRQMHGLAAGFPPFAWNPSLFTSFGTSSPAPEAGKAPRSGKEAAAEARDMKDIVAELQKQVAGLQQELKKAKSRRAAR
jgi:polyhydroxyalkanoate synthesis repressor PhaR